MSKKQNATIGAVIGGALLGPLGVAIGAAVGAMAEDDSISQDNNHLLKYDNVDIQEEMKKVIASYSSDDFYKTESIPQKKREAAIHNYPVPRQEFLFALVDATLLGSAKVGMAIGSQGIYWKNDWTTETAKNFLSWEEMAKSSQPISTKILSYDLFLGNGCVFNMSGSQMKAKYLAELLNKLVSLYRVSAQQKLKRTTPTPTKVIDDLVSTNAKSSAQALAEKIKKTMAKQDVIYEELLRLHNKSLQDLISRFNGDNEFHDTVLDLFCVLIDEQLRVIASQIDMIKIAVAKEEKLTQEDNLISPTIQICLFIFSCVHNYSLSKLPKSFLDVLVSNDFYFQAITMAYLEAYSAHLDVLYPLDKNILDSEFIQMIPLVFFDRTAEERYLNMSREKLLMGLLERVNMSEYVAQNISNKFDAPVKKWYMSMGKFLDGLED